MTKDDYIWVAIRIFGIYLLVLSIVAIPDAIAGFYGAIVLSDIIPSGKNDIADLGVTYQKAALADGIKGIFQVLIFSVCALYFTKHGNFVYKIASKTNA